MIPNTKNTNTVGLNAESFVQRNTKLFKPVVVDIAALYFETSVLVENGCMFVV